MQDKLLGKKREFFKLFDILPPIMPVSYYVALCAKNQFFDERDYQRGKLFILALVPSVLADIPITPFWIIGKVVRAPFWILKQVNASKK